MVNSEKQRAPGEPLELLEFSVLPNVKRASFGDLRGRLYPGVRQLRTVIVRNDYVLDFFQVQAPEARQIDWLTHVDGVSVTNSELEPIVVAFRKEVPWNYLKEPHAARSGPHYWEKFRDAADASKTLSVDLWSDTPLEIVQCGFPLDESAEPRTIPMRLARCHRRQAWFLAIYRTGALSSARISAVVDEADLNSWKITLTRDGVMSAHIVPRMLQY